MNHEDLLGEMRMLGGTHTSPGGPPDVGEDLATAGDAPAAAAEVLAAASRLIEGDDGGPLTRAARDDDRAAREVRGRLPEPTVAGTLLRTAALQMARGTRSHRGEAAQILMRRSDRSVVAVGRRPS